MPLASPVRSRPAAAFWYGRIVVLLRLFVEIRREEAAAAVLLGINGLLMMTSYYILKTVREPLILLGGGRTGVELKTYATAVQALLLLGVVPLYGLLASRVDRLRLIRATMAFLVVSLVVFSVLGDLGVPIGVAYYLWLGMSSLIGVAQFWSFANDYYTTAQGERLFPVIATGGSLGAILGAGLARWLLARIGVLQLMLVAAGLFVAYTAVFGLIERIERPEPADVARKPLAGAGGFQLVMKSRYLLLIGLMVMVANLVNTQGEYVLARAVTAQAEKLVPAPAAPSARTSAAVIAARRVAIGNLYGEFYGGVSLFGFLIQIFAVSRIFRHLGIHRALYVFPLIALGAYGSMAALPVFVLIAAAKTVENSADYSLHNTVRQALFLPTSREAKYKAKAAIDSFFLRSGDLIAGATVFAGVHVLGLSARWFALSNMVLIVVWMGIVTVLARQYRRLAAERAATPGAPDRNSRRTSALYPGVE
jgi:AAA family ATP:ADP antiporter